MWAGNGRRAVHVVLRAGAQGGSVSARASENGIKDPRGGKKSLVQAIFCCPRRAACYTIISILLLFINIFDTQLLTFFQMVQLGAQAFGAGAVFVAVVLSSVLAHFGEQRFGFVDLVVFDNYVKVCLVRLPGPVGLGEGARRIPTVPAGRRLGMHSAVCGWNR